MDWPERGFMFCACRGVKVLWVKAIGYDTVRKQFKAKCELLGLGRLDIHSCRIGGASESSRMGARREVIKTVGNWKSSAVDVYIRPEEPMAEVIGLLTAN